MHPDDDTDDPGSFRLSNLIDLVFPRWKDVIVVHQHDSSMGKAMRYYRVWIYVSCIVTAIPAIIFASVVAWIFTADYFKLLPLEFYDWTFLYLYAAIFFQIFIGPCLGCLGATKLSERLLWAYWGSMVALCTGDAIIGIVWAMKFTHLNREILSHLHTLLTNRYGTDQDFTSLWNEFQSNEKCCGVENATEFIRTQWYQNLTATAALNHVTFPAEPSYVLPASCCVPAQNMLTTFSLSCTVPSLATPLLHRQGCYLALHTWMHSMGDILFVLGYSIIAFVRAALAFCLYNEIKHFIRKIYIRGVPREMHHASVSAGSDLVNFHRNNSAGKVGTDKKRSKLPQSSSGIPPVRPHDRSLRRWSFVRGWRSFRNIVQNRSPSPPNSMGPPFTASSSTIKLKSINEENTSML